MRPSQKSGRGRGKGNRSNKGAAHSPNRVYESAGPEGKVRGTPQQIIDKYQQLSRDAQLSGDRVNSENFLQHAEHYARILVTIQEEQDRRNQQQQQQQPQQQRRHHDDQDGGQGAGQGNGGQNNGGQNDGAQDTGGQDGGGRGQHGGNDRRDSVGATDDQPPSDGLAALGADSGPGPDIVETPEAKSPRPQRSRRPRPKPQETKAEDPAPAAPTPAESES